MKRKQQVVPPETGHSFFFGCKSEEKYLKMEKGEVRKLSNALKNTESKCVRAGRIGEI